MYIKSVNFKEKSVKFTDRRVKFTEKVKIVQIKV